MRPYYECVCAHHNGENPSIKPDKPCISLLPARLRVRVQYGAVPAVLVQLTNMTMLPAPAGTRTVRKVWYARSPDWTLARCLPRLPRGRTHCTVSVPYSYCSGIFPLRLSSALHILFRVRCLPRPESAVLSILPPALPPVLSTPQQTAGAATSVRLVELNSSGRCGFDSAAPRFARQVTFASSKPYLAWSSVPPLYHLCPARRFRNFDWPSGETK